MHMHDEFPSYRGRMEYACQQCGARYSGQKLHYTCPECKGVFLLEDIRFQELMATDGAQWREIFDGRARSKHPALRGIFRFYELISPIVEPNDIVWLGEGNTPIVRANSRLEGLAGQTLAFKNDGQNPSASFKDRGMACALSAIKAMARMHDWTQVLTICASTGDTSASAAMYAAYVGPPVTAVVLLPQGRVTPQQLGQPLGSGAMVLELPGVFDDCMRVVEHLADHYRVALLNSKNSWRILGQESYAFEVAQWYDWDVSGKSLFVPIGNAGNISAIMAGCLKLHRLGVIEKLPRIFGVQSRHADPVYRYYSQPEGERLYSSVSVSPSVAQAAMIGNPVSFPRVASLVRSYEDVGGRGSFNVVQVEEERIMESMLLANRHGHIACTQGGECLAGLLRAKELGLMDRDELVVLDATAHSLKFMGFQEMYFQDRFPPEYGIQTKEELRNQPLSVLSQDDKDSLTEQDFVARAAQEIVQRLGLE
ncbi:MAG: threonine synthase [Desulfovermiculus sp.]|nr:threonine synthase [Desulfovermiculus sp.]